MDVGHNASSLALGGASVCVIRDDGRVVCWGSNSNGQLGIGKNTTTIGAVAGQTGNNLQEVSVGTGQSLLFASQFFIMIETLVLKGC